MSWRTTSQSQQAAELPSSHILNSFLTFQKGPSHAWSGRDSPVTVIPDVSATHGQTSKVRAQWSNAIVPYQPVHSQHIHHLPATPPLTPRLSSVEGSDLPTVVIPGMNVAWDLRKYRIPDLTGPSLQAGDQCAVKEQKNGEQIMKWARHYGATERSTKLETNREKLLKAMRYHLDFQHRTKKWLRERCRIYRVCGEWLEADHEQLAQAANSLPLDTRQKISGFIYSVPVSEPQERVVAAEATMARSRRSSPQISDTSESLIDFNEPDAVALSVLPIPLSPRQTERNCVPQTRPVSPHLFTASTLVSKLTSNASSSSSGEISEIASEATSADIWMSQFRISTLEKENQELKQLVSTLDTKFAALSIRNQHVEQEKVMDTRNLHSLLAYVQALETYHAGHGAATNLQALHETAREIQALVNF